jgi:hypothetical protein
MAQPPRDAKWLLVGDLVDGKEPAPKDWTTLSNVVRPLIRWSLSSEGARRLKSLDQARLRDEAVAKTAEDRRRERAYPTAAAASAATLRQAREEKAAQAAQRVAALKQVYRKAELASAARAKRAAALEGEGARAADDDPRRRAYDMAKLGSNVAAAYAARLKRACEEAETPRVERASPDSLSPLFAAIWAVLDRCPSQAILQDNMDPKEVPDLLTPPLDRHEGANAHVALMAGTVGSGTADAALSRYRFRNLEGRPVLVRPEEVTEALRVLGIGHSEPGGKAEEEAERALRAHLKAHGKDRSKRELWKLIAPNLSERAWEDRVCPNVKADYPEISRPGRPRKHRT